MFGHFIPDMSVQCKTLVKNRLQIVYIHASSHVRLNVYWWIGKSGRQCYIALMQYGRYDFDRLLTWKCHNWQGSKMQSFNRALFGHATSLSDKKYLCFEHNMVICFHLICLVMSSSSLCKFYMIFPLWKCDMVFSSPFPGITARGTTSVECVIFTATRSQTSGNT